MVHQIALVDAETVANRGSQGQRPRLQTARCNRQLSHRRRGSYLSDLHARENEIPHYTLPAFPLLALLLARHRAPQGAALSEAPTAAAESSSFLVAKFAITSAIIYLALALFVFPFTARFFPSLQLFKASKNYLKAEMEFGAVGYNEPSLVWYFRSRVNRFLILHWMRKVFRRS